MSDHEDSENLGDYTVFYFDNEAEEPVLHVFSVKSGYLRFSSDALEKEFVEALISKGVPIVKESCLPKGENPILKFIEKLDADGVEEPEFSKRLQEYCKQVRPQFSQGGADSSPK